jgi:hypothetical protein
MLLTDPDEAFKGEMPQFLRALRGSTL